MEKNNINAIRIKSAGLWMVFAIIMRVTGYFEVANASDPSPLQDFCVAVDDPYSAVIVNGRFCKNPKDVETEDLVYKGFNIPGDTNNTQGAEATLVDINRFPALNTLGVSMARIDFGPFGLNTLHSHPRSSEIFAVLEGTLYAGIVTTDYKLYDTVLRKGDMIVFPQGLIHFQLNLGKTNAFAVASFGSQNPGRINVVDGLFGTRPRILDDVLTKAFQVDETLIQRLRSQFSRQNLSINTTGTGRSILQLFVQTTNDCTN